MHCRKKQLRQPSIMYVPSKIASIHLGMTPACIGSENVPSGPVIVCVLPEDVWP